MAFGAPFSGSEVLLHQFMQRKQQKDPTNPNKYNNAEIKSFPAGLPEPVTILHILFKDYQAQLQLLLTQLQSHTSNTNTAREFTFETTKQNDLENLLGSKDYTTLKGQVRSIITKSARLANAIKLPKNSNTTRFEQALEQFARQLKEIAGLQIHRNAGWDEHETLLEALRDSMSIDLQEKSGIRTTYRPSPLIIAQWNMEDSDTQELISDIQGSIEHLKKIFAKFRKPVLKDFSKKAVIASWPLDVTPNLNDKIYNDSDSELLSENPSLASERDGSILEVLLNKYPRTEVPAQDLSPQGQLRGICKLIMSYQNSKYEFGGTGWLIGPSTVVTCAHNLYDRESGKHATKVAVFIGRKDNEATVDTKQEKVYARIVAVHWGYYKHSQKWNDFAIMELIAPFQDVQVIAWRDTPLSSGKTILKVVGYPGDLPHDSKEEVKGKVMYQSECPVSWYDLVADNYTLRYGLDTNKGNSGSPILTVLPDKTFYSIGVHCRGLITNSGVVLGHQGNVINAFRDAIRLAETSSSGLKSETLTVLAISGTIIGLKKMKIVLAK